MIAKPASSWRLGGKDLEDNEQAAIDAMKTLDRESCYRDGVYHQKRKRSAIANKVDAFASSEALTIMKPSDDQKKADHDAYVS